MTGASGIAARSRSQRPTERQVQQGQLIVPYIALALLHAALVILDFHRLAWMYTTPLKSSMLPMY